MHILGLANGSENGNSEILLKAALLAARDADPSLTVSWIHVPSIWMPPGMKPLEGFMDVSMGKLTTMQGGKSNAHNLPDDRRAVVDAILNADALIFSTATYSHQPAGFLKAVVDRILGPFTDFALARRATERKAAGDPHYKDQIIDPRLLKPRIAAFMACGGSTTPDQFTMVLPTLHLFVYSMHAKVVDQCIFPAVGTPGSVLAYGRRAVLERAQQLGRNVASQIGKPFDEAKYLGEEPRGACPYCHLNKMELLSTTNNEIGCVTCGAKGKLTVHESGLCQPVWNVHCDVSSITLAGKLRHLDDIVVNGGEEAKMLQSDPDVDERRRHWQDVKIPRVSMPSASLSR